MAHPILAISLPCRASRLSRSAWASGLACGYAEAEALRQAYLESITHEQCEAVALQRDIAGAGLDHAEVDVGCRGSRGHGSPQLGATRPPIVGENRLRCRRSLTHRQPIRACADAIPRAVDRALQVITRVRQQVPNPDVHKENVLRRIFLLAELEEPEPIVPRRTAVKLKCGTAAMADDEAGLI